MTLIIQNKIKILENDILIYHHQKWTSFLELNGQLSCEAQKKICLELSKSFFFMPNLIKSSAKQKCSNLLLKDDFINEIIFYGGSFNPLHDGHIECLKQMNGKPILVIPDNNPFKNSYSKNPLDQYINLYIKLNNVNNLKVSIYPAFITNDKANPTIDWIDKVKIKNKFLLMGDDSFLSLLKWKEIKQLLNILTGLYIVPRQKDSQKLKEQQKKILEYNPKLKIIFMKNHQYENVSSSNLRLVNKSL